MKNTLNSFLLLSGILVGLLFCSCDQGYAQNINSRNSRNSADEVEILETISLQKLFSVAQFLEEQDILSDVHMLDDKPMFVVSYEGTKFIFRVNDKNTFIMVNAYFTEAEISLARLNKWNMDKNFGRVYIDSDDDVVFEDELLVDGTTIVNVALWMNIVCSSGEDFAEGDF